MDLCVCIDGILCTAGLCRKEEGDGRDPGCAKKFFCPITSVVDAVGHDKYTDIWLAYGFGCFYTLCCFDPEYYTRKRVARNYYEPVVVGNEKN